MSYIICARPRRLTSVQVMPSVHHQDVLSRTGSRSPSVSLASATRRVVAASSTAICGKRSLVQVVVGLERRLPAIGAAVPAADPGLVHAPVALGVDVAHVEERLDHAVVAHLARPRRSPCAASSPSAAPARLRTPGRSAVMISFQPFSGSQKMTGRVASSALWRYQRSRFSSSMGRAASSATWLASRRNTARSAALMMISSAGCGGGAQSCLGLVAHCISDRSWMLITQHG